MAQVLRHLPHVSDPRVLVDSGSFDDGACVLVRDDLAIVATVDFFTPVVDDPRDFGRIAAANAISDVYAMGGTPLCALAVSGVPAGLDPAITGAIFAGGAEVALQAGIVVVGGHTIVDREPKYGLVVLGTVHPDRIWRNGGGRAGDVLVLTKPLGSGIVANALRHDAVDPEILAAAVESMATLNRAAAEAIHRVGGPHGATDVTGFGLVGHAHEMALAAGVEAHVDARNLPLLPGVVDLVRAGHVPGGSNRNAAAAAAYATVMPGVDPALLAIACDAQTSGGLLVALSRRDADGIGVVIGELCDGQPGRVMVR